MTAGAAPFHCNSWTNPNQTTLLALTAILLALSSWLHYIVTCLGYLTVSDQSLFLALPVFNVRSYVRRRVSGSGSSLKRYELSLSS